MKIRIVFQSAAPDTTEPAPRWQDNAECRKDAYKAHRDLWFSDSRQGDIEYALDICIRQCPVRAECAQYAYERREEFGIWGGFTEQQRRNLLRRERRAREQANKRAAAEQPPKGGRPLAACGSRSAYQRHVRKGEPIDDACRAANTKADARLRSSGSTKALA